MKVINLVTLLIDVRLFVFCYANSSCYDCIEDWKVSNEMIFSHHRLIMFTVISPIRAAVIVGRNPKLTYWVAHKERIVKH